MNRARSILIESGWTEEQIEDYLTDEALLAYKDVVSYDIEEHYLRIDSEGNATELSEESCMEEVAILEETNTRGTVPLYSETENNGTTTDGYMKFTLTAYNCGNRYYIISARYEWLIDPIQKKIDIFALTHDATLTIDDSFNIYYVYKTDVVDGVNATSYETVTYTPTSMITSSAGVCVTQDLYNNSSNIIHNHHRGYLQYKVRVNNIYHTAGSIHCIYAHQESLISITPSISMVGELSITVSSSIFFKFMSPNLTMTIDY